MSENENAEDLPRRRFLKLSGAAGAAAILAGAGHNLATAQTPGPTPSPECGYTTDTDHVWNAAKYCNGGGTGCAALRTNANDYVFAGSKFHQSNYITVPKERVMGIECPWVTDSKAPNYWQDAWDWAGSMVGAEVGLGINSKNARSAHQLHIHMATVRSYSLKDVTDHDSSAAKSFGDWHKRLVSITGWNGKIQTQHVYRVVHVGSFGTVNLFDQLRMMVGQKDMVNQTLIVIPRPSSKGGGYYIVNSQASLTGLSSLKGSDTCDPLLLIQAG
jgi:CDP-diacylglycerol pyrophosphatase